MRGEKNISYGQFLGKVKLSTTGFLLDTALDSSNVGKEGGNWEGDVTLL